MPPSSARLFSIVRAQKAATLQFHCTPYIVCHFRRCHFLGTQDIETVTLLLFASAWKMQARFQSRIGPNAETSKLRRVAGQQQLVILTFPRDVTNRYANSILKVGRKFGAGEPFTCGVSEGYMRTIGHTPSAQIQRPPRSRGRVERRTWPERRRDRPPSRVPGTRARR